MEADVLVREVDVVETRGKNKRYVLRDDEGREYATFREQIGERALDFRGKRAHIEFHEEQRGQYRNVYLDRVEEAAAPAEHASGESDPDEAAWQTAVEAAPWLVGEKAPEEAASPQELFDRLKPFKDLVAEDIREDRGEGSEE